MSKKTIYIIGLFMIVLSLIAIVFSKNASATMAEKSEIHATKLDDYSCGLDQWRFIITDVVTEDRVPESVEVTWSDDTTSLVHLFAYSEKAADYRGTDHMNDKVVSAKTDIYVAWDGQFTLFQGPPCDDPVPPVDRCPDGTVVIASVQDGILGCVDKDQVTVNDNQVDIGTAESIEAPITTVIAAPVLAVEVAPAFTG